jgi:hypothetical protein
MEVPAGDSEAGRDVRSLILEYWKSNDKVCNDARGTRKKEIHYVKEGRR